MQRNTTRAHEGRGLPRLVTWKHYYVYVNALAPVQLPPCSVADLEFACTELPITLAGYERLARSGQNLRLCHGVAAEGGSRHRTFVFLTTTHGEMVNVTGMTATRTGSVYSQVSSFWPSFRDDDVTLYAGYSETVPEHRRKGVYSWVHGRIFAWARTNGFRRIVLLEGEDQSGPRSSQDKLGSTVVAETCHVTLFNGLRSSCRVHVWVNSRRLVRLLAPDRVGQ